MAPPGVFMSSFSCMYVYTLEFFNFRAILRKDTIHVHMRQLTRMQALEAKS